MRIAKDGILEEESPPGPPQGPNLFVRRGRDSGGCLQTVPHPRVRPLMQDAQMSCQERAFRSPAQRVERGGKTTGKQYTVVGSHAQLEQLGIARTGIQEGPFGNGPLDSVQRKLTAGVQSGVFIDKG